MSADRLWSPTSTAAWTRTPSGTVVVMDVTRDFPLELSPTGSAVWEELVDGVEPDQDLADVLPRGEATIVAALARDFGVDRDVIRQDVADFLAMLEDHGVAEPS